MKYLLAIVALPLLMAVMAVTFLPYIIFSWVSNAVDNLERLFK